MVDPDWSGGPELQFVTSLTLVSALRGLSWITTTFICQHTLEKCCGKRTQYGLQIGTLLCVFLSAY